MIENKIGFIAFIDSLRLSDSTKRTYRSWVNRIDRNLPKELSLRSVQSEDDVKSLARSMSKKAFTPGHIKDVRCIIRYYLKFCIRAGVRVQQDIAEAAGEFSSNSELEAHRRILRSIAVRRGQPKFRERLMAAYNGKCCVTGTDASDVLEAAHIQAYARAGSYSVNNGLLLRADIHILFDLRFLSIDPTTRKIYCSKQLRRISPYENLNGNAVRFPLEKKHWPDKEALTRHFKETKE